MAVILRQGLKYAVLKGYISKNPYEGVVEHTKTDNSIRKVYLTTFVRDLLKQIEEKNRKDNNQEEDYIFCRK